MERAVLLSQTSSLTQALQSILPAGSSEFTNKNLSPLGAPNIPAADTNASHCLPANYIHVDFTLPYKDAMAQMEDQYLKNVLARHNGNVAKTIAALGIHRATFYRKIKDSALKKR